MQCRLCLQERELRNSHIIPEFLYRPGYDEKGRMEVLRRTSPKTRYIQKGFREYLLCDECEGLLANSYEDYFAKLWYIRRPIRSPISPNHVRLTGLNYTLFKLFILSVLWRAGISSLEPFAQIRLGPHEERIRRMLVEGVPGPASLYQIVGVIVLFPGSREILEGVMMAPTASRFEGKRTYMFIFGGCAWHIVEGPRPISGFQQATLSEAGEMILPVRDSISIKPLISFFREHIRSE